MTCVESLKIFHYQVCVRQRHQEVRDVLADSSAEPRLWQQLQVPSFSFTYSLHFDLFLILIVMISALVKHNISRFPDGSSGGNAPAGGSGQVIFLHLDYLPSLILLFLSHVRLFTFLCGVLHQGNFNNDDEDDLYS